MANSITADEIREQFSQAMSAMYQQEVPQYGTLLELVADVNLAVLENNPQLHEKMVNADELARLNVERQGWCTTYCGTGDITFGYRSVSSATKRDDLASCDNE